MNNKQKEIIEFHLKDLFTSHEHEIFKDFDDYNFNFRKFGNELRVKSNQPDKPHIWFNLSILPSGRVTILNYQYYVHALCDKHLIGFKEFEKLFGQWLVKRHPEMFNLSESYFKRNKNVRIIGDFPNGSWFKNEYDSNGNNIYFENCNGYWIKSEYNFNNKLTFFEDSKGYWIKCEYDSNGDRIKYESSTGYWGKSEYDSNSNEIYYENSDGYWFKYDSNGNQIDRGYNDNFPTPEEIKQYVDKKPGF